MDRSLGAKVGIGLLVFAALLLVLHLAPAEAQIKWGAYFKKHQSVMKQPDAISASIARGKKFFNEIGCGGCHPRGGTIGGTALNAAGFRVPFEIGDLHGAATHFPRFATKKAILVDLGEMNDL